jgi:hypothetical protein
MPRIQSFEAPENLALHPSEVGEAAWREAGGVARQFGNQSGQQLNQAAGEFGKGIARLGSGFGDLYDDMQAHDDTLATTEMSKKSTDFEMQKHDELQHLMDPQPDPNDPSGKTLVPRDPNKVQAYTGEFLNKWWEDRKKLRATITNEAALKKFDAETDQAYKSISSQAYSQSGEVNFKAVSDNIVKTTQNRAGMVFDNPTRLDEILEAHHADMAHFAGVVPNISMSEKETLRHEMDTKGSKAIIERAIDSLSRTEEGRKKAEEIVRSGKYDDYIGEERGTLLDHIHKMKDADYADAEHKRKLEEQENKDADDAHLQEIINDANSKDPKYKLSDIYTDPKFHNPEYRDKASGILTRMRSFNEKGEDVDKYQSAQMARTVVDKLTKPDGDPEKWQGRDKIDDLYIHKFITKEDYEFLLKKQEQLQKGVYDKFDKDSAQEIAKWRNILDPYRDAAGNHSALGDSKQKQLEHDLNVERARMIRENKDPNDLLREGSPDYFFTNERMKNYYTSEDEATKFKGDIAKSFDDTMKKYHQNVPDAKPSTLFGGTPDAHYDKNLFSSGRAAQLGISMKPGDESQMVTFDVGGKSITTNKYAAPYFKAFLEDLQRQGYNIKTLSGFVARGKNLGGGANIFNGYSEHAFGNAIDINGFVGNGQGENAATDLPTNIRATAAKYGLIWGGDWRGTSRDTMHFEWAGKRGAYSEDVASHTGDDGRRAKPAPAPEGSTAEVPLFFPKGGSGGSVGDVARNGAGHFTPNPKQVIAMTNSGQYGGQTFIIPDGAYKGMVGTFPQVPKRPNVRPPRSE